MNLNHFIKQSVEEKEINAILLFSITVEIDPAESDQLGEDLASFLQESWFNGEDVLEVKYIGQKIPLS